jgi:hypothetical protein
MSPERSVKDLFGPYKDNLEARVGFEPTNGGFAVLRSRAKLFIFLGDFVGLDRLTTLLLPHSVSSFVRRILLYSSYRG